LENIFGKVERQEERHGCPLRRRTLFLEQRKKPGSKPGFPVLLTAGGVIISTLIDPRSIIVVAGVGVIPIVRRGIAVAWAIAVVAIIVGASCDCRT
jgi:hypothetical protein